MSLIQTDLLDELVVLLDVLGFVVEDAPAGSWPDKPTVAIFSDDQAKPGSEQDVGFVLLCANQCARDKQHKCGVAVTFNALTTSSWLPAVGEAVPWMVLSWGPHLHQLPLCSVKCLVEFVERRAGDGGMRRNGHH